MKDRIFNAFQFRSMLQFLQTSATEAATAAAACVACESCLRYRPNLRMATVVTGTTTKDSTEHK